MRNVGMHQMVAYEKCRDAPDGRVSYEKCGDVPEGSS